MYQNFAILCIIILIYSLIAGKVEKKPISSAMFFLFVGLVLGPFTIDFFSIKFNEEVYKTLAECALALVLFTDASKANLKTLKGQIAIPYHLLLIGLPITIIFGVLIGKLVFPAMSWIELGILSTILAPTDAALGEPVVNHKSVPAKVREGINVESGLNDGICVPILLLLMSIYKFDANEHVTFGFAFGLFIKEIGIGVLVGATLAYLGSLVIKHGLTKQWIESAWKPSIVIVMALTCFSLAQTLDGSGFIATFVGGLIFNRALKNHKSTMLTGALGVGKILNAVVWIVFGSVITAEILPLLTLPIILYSILSLTVIRILPVLLCLLNNKISGYSKLFIAWFGPRGLASIVFAAMVFEGDLAYGNTIVLTACCTILISVFVHGISAEPMTKFFTSKTKK
ncbi:cation:proton antiporter [Carboxylicivirga linearis]|uniref:Cation:proton antiporter n=1 Tax=Carboxylicivirga linearis TaxID=1628157 RepID=A0ABS5K0E4_9BACT|nr:cation:proton antiporter [Carboxylicivirga linearis]MBS2100209.1 cation:proton antiporter [Carboxylicivirga linearis]